MKKSITLRGFSAYRLWTQLPRIEVSHLPDVIMFGAGIALFYAVVTVGHSWFGPFTPTVEISRSLRALPTYAGYSLLRITIAYVLSFLDRQVLSILVEPIKAELHLKDAAIGILTKSLLKAA